MLWNRQRDWSEKRWERSSDDQRVVHWVVPRDDCWVGLSAAHWAAMWGASLAGRSGLQRDFDLVGLSALTLADRWERWTVTLSAEWKAEKTVDPRVDLLDTLLAEQSEQH